MSAPVSMGHPRERTAGRRTLRKAPLTLESVMSSFLQRFSTRARFDAPELRQAIFLIPLRCRPMLYRFGRVELARRGVGNAARNRRTCFLMRACVRGGPGGGGRGAGDE